MTIKEAHERLDKEYYKACAQDYISDPLMTAAGALFEALEVEHNKGRGKVEYDALDKSKYEWR